MWLFALMAHDGLSNLHPLLWGFPLVLALFYLVGFATHSCYKDFAELKKGLQADEEGEPENSDGPGDDAPAWFDDADAEAGRAPEEDQDEEEAVYRARRPTSRVSSIWRSTWCFAITKSSNTPSHRDVTQTKQILGESATAEQPPAAPPPHAEAQLASGLIRHRVRLTMGFRKWLTIRRPWNRALPSESRRRCSWPRNCVSQFESTERAGALKCAACV